MLEGIYSSYKQLADTVDWKKYNCNDLFYEYIKHENDQLSSAFYAGIVCRYWGYSGRVYSQCNGHVTFEQCYDVLIDTINYVLQKRVWENPESSLYNDHSAPDKAFHIVLKRMRGILLASLSAAKRKSNFNTLSIDEIHEKYSDAADGLFDISEDEFQNDSGDDDYLLTIFIRRQPILNVVLLDAICFQTDGQLPSVVRYVKGVSEEDYRYYFDRYEVREDEFHKFILALDKMSSKELMFELKKMLYILRGQMD